MTEALRAKLTDTGLLILRIGIGIMFLIHGWPKISGGPDMWNKLGPAVGFFGIHWAPEFWGFMAAVAEFGGGLALIVGVLFRPFCVLLTINMLVASVMVFKTGGGFAKTAHPAELTILFLSLILIGSGSLTLPRLLKGLSGSK